MHVNANAFRILAALINVARTVLITQTATHDAGNQLTSAHAQPSHRASAPSSRGPMSASPERSSTPSFRRPGVL
jgi:hypothetical protein